MRQIIYNKLSQELEPFILDVRDESELHRGHSGYKENKQTHFNIFIISEKFENYPRIERERLIHTILAHELKSEIHALKLRIMSQNEWHKSKKIHNFNSEILRAYDIRGTIGKNLSELDAYYLGRSFASIIKNRGFNNRIAVGFDGRLSSPKLNQKLILGLRDSGAEVMHIGLVPTPQLYYATFKLNCDAGIMITGSHNPPNDNGFKLMLGGLSFFGEDITKLNEIAREGDFTEAKGSYKETDINIDYINALIEKALKTPSKKLKIAWDAGNGATGDIVELLTKQIEGTHILLNTKIDGTFPAHHPDPSVAKNLEQLIKSVIDNNCDFGIAFDGDGDRIGVVDNLGRMIFGEQLLLIMAQALLKDKPGSKIIADVKTSDIIFNEIKRLGGQPIMWKTGHSFIKKKMKEEHALLAGEMSGHMFFGENYYGFDDALFAACKLINILSHSIQPLNEIIDNLPKGFSTPEIRIEVSESKKFELIDKIKTILNALKIHFNDIDGVRVSDERGCWLIRASNTQAILVLRIESSSNEMLTALINHVKLLLERVGVIFNID